MRGSSPKCRNSERASLTPFTSTRLSSAAGGRPTRRRRNAKQRARGGCTAARGRGVCSSAEGRRARGCRCVRSNDDLFGICTMRSQSHGRTANIFSHFLHSAKRSPSHVSRQYCSSSRQFTLTSRARVSTLSNSTVEYARQTRDGPRVVPASLRVQRRRTVAECVRLA